MLQVWLSVSFISGWKDLNIQSTGDSSPADGSALYKWCYNKTSTFLINWTLKQIAVIKLNPVVELKSRMERKQNQN